MLSPHQTNHPPGEGERQPQPPDWMDTPEVAASIKRAVDRALANILHNRYEETESFDPLGFDEREELPAIKFQLP